MITLFTLKVIFDGTDATAVIVTAVRYVAVSALPVRENEEIVDVCGTSG